VTMLERLHTSIPPYSSLSARYSSICIKKASHIRKGYRRMPLSDAAVQKVCVLPLHPPQWLHKRFSNQRILQLLSRLLSGTTFIAIKVVAFVCCVSSMVFQCSFSSISFVSSTHSAASLS
jgi:hypothetical protein